MAIQKLKMSDVRVRRGEVIAAPRWAFLGTWGDVSRIPEVWQDLRANLARIQEKFARRPGHRRFSSCWRLKHCVVCGTTFGGRLHVSACTDKCAEIRRKATRTRGTKPRERVCHQPKPCKHCRESFWPRRADAVYCSTRCRVADHRLRND
jgi:hypothetical protein